MAVRFAALAALLAAMLPVLNLLPGSDAHAAGRPVQVGMPFSGKWAYNVDAGPPYDDIGESHPSAHRIPGGGDWGTDLYAPAGTPVKLSVASTGALSFSWRATTNGGCGQRTVVNINVDGVFAGWMYYEHLNGAVKSGPITNGMTLGYVADFGACNGGPHIHVEMASAANYACYADYGRPGVTLAGGKSLGLINAPNTGPKQACAGSGSISGGGNQFLADVTGDNRVDAVVYFPSDGAWYVAPSAGNRFLGYTRWIGGHGVGSSNQLMADVNGDKRADALVYFPGNGTWYVALSTGSGFGGYRLWIGGHGVGSSNQMVGDVNGDGKADALVYFGGNGTWYVSLSSGSAFGGYRAWIGGHGVGSSNQLLGDVTGDGKADAIVYFGGNGTWYVAPSTGGWFGGYRAWAGGHGVGSSNQLLKDVTGDRRADAVVFFPGNGTWYVATSNGGGFNAYKGWIGGHGVGSSNQMLGDGNGDGRAEAAVFFTGNGSWYLAYSTSTGSFYIPSQWIIGHGAGS